MAINFTSKIQDFNPSISQLSEPLRDSTVVILGSLRSSSDQYENKIIPLYKEKGLDEGTLRKLKPELVSDYITPYIKLTSNLARRIANAGRNVLTGGGPGVMEAANSSASDVDKSKSWAIATKDWRKFNIDQISNLVTTTDFAAERSEMFSHKGKRIIALPGGFGTLHELFIAAENMSYNQENSPEKIILVGKKFYKPLIKFLKSAEDKNLAKNVDKIFKIVDTEEEVIKELNITG